MGYNVIVSKPARADIINIGRYIAKQLHAPQSSANLVSDIHKSIADLKHMPKKYALVSDKRLAMFGIRSIPVKNYLVFYFVDDEAKTVNVIRILYGKREWANLL